MYEGTSAIVCDQLYPKSYAPNCPNHLKAGYTNTTYLGFNMSYISQATPVLSDLRMMGTVPAQTVFSENIVVCSVCGSFGAETSGDTEHIALDAADDDGPDRV